MDFQYTFRQSHQDRLGDAGVVQYRPIDEFAVIKPKREKRLSPAPRLHRLVALFVNAIALSNLIK